MTSSSSNNDKILDYHSFREEEYQYNEARYYPIEEYLVSSVERLTSDTPAFVMEVTWPRVVLFYHPASTLCLELRDRYVATAREIRRRSIRTMVEFWAVNCNLHRDSCEELGVISVPKLLVFRADHVDSIVIPRTNENTIDISVLKNVLNIKLEDEDEKQDESSSLSSEEKRLALLHQNNIIKLEEIEKRAEDANDPEIRIDLGDTHMEEILHPHSSLDSSSLYTDAITSLLLSIDISRNRWSSWEEYRIFREWIDLLHWSLPTRDMAKAHNIVNDLRNNILSIRDKPEEIKNILRLHNCYTKDEKWSPSCSYSCGLWKLFHILSIGVYVQHEQVLGDTQRVLVPHVVATIQDYIRHFAFASDDEGREIAFLQAFQQNCNSNNVDICQKKEHGGSGKLLNFLNNDKENIDEHYWKELAIFVWKIHQNFRRNQNNKNIEDYHWPSLSACPMCHYSSSSSLTQQHVNNDDILLVQSNNIVWNKEILFNYIKQQYWPHTLQTPRMVVLDQWNSNNNMTTLAANYHDAELIAIFIFTTVLFLLYYTWKQIKIQRIRKRRRENYRMNSIWLGPPPKNDDNNNQTRRRRRFKGGGGGGISSRGRSNRFRPASRPFLDD